MAVSPVSSVPRRLSTPISSEKPTGKGKSDEVSRPHTPPSKGGTLHPSTSLADIQARQQSPNTPVRNSGGDADSGATLNNDPVSQSFVESFSAAAADPSTFTKLLNTTFGDNIDQAKAEQFRQSALQGDFSFLPNVEYVDASVLKGGNGAFSADTNTIYINKELKGTELAEQTFVEEAGHFLDSKLNTSDTRGDEGELFRRILNGESLSDEALDAIRSEDDSGTINVNGKEVEVEFWSLGGFISDVADAAGNAVNSVVDTVGDAISGAGEAAGNVVTGAANLVGDVVSGAGNMVGGVLNTAGNAIGGSVGNVLSSAGNGISTVGNTIGNGISNGVSWVNDNIVQPVINTGIELVQDVVPIGIGVASWPLHTLGNAVRGSSETFSALLEGDFSGAWDSFTNTVKDFVLAPAELVVTTIALTINAAVNVVNNLFSLTDERGLNQEELDYLRPIFGDSIDYGSIRIQSGGIKETFNISPQTTGNDIFMRQEWDGDDIFKSDGTLTEEGLHLLGHEVGHVWQNQNGGITYVGDALITQTLDAVGIGEGYEIDEALRRGVEFEEMNPEQQASVAEFIGMAIEADGSLTKAGFERAAVIDPPLSAEAFAIVQAAHDLLRGA